jgi:hypothetical protein
LVYTYLRSLTSCVIGITPQDDLPDLVQNAVSLLKIPLALFTSLVRQIALQKVKELNSLVLYPRELVLGYAGLAGGDIPFHTANEDFNDISTGISNMRQAVQAGAWLGSVDGCVDELDLVRVYISIHMYILSICKYIPGNTFIYRNIPSIYWYIPSSMHLRGDEVTNHEGQGEH